MNSDLSVPVQYLNYMIISTASSEIRLLEVEQACQTAFFIFLSSLLIARGIGEEWSFYMLGVFFNTVLLSPLFFPSTCLHPKSCEIKSLFPYTPEINFSVFIYILAVKSFIPIKTVFLQF